MSKARLYFTGDNGVQKADREYGLTQEIVQKVNNIPGVVDNTSSTSATDALSANMGRDLQEQINNLSVMGRFLSTRNAATGLPDTNPQTSPYAYVTGDYYVVSTVATGGADNYRPNGSSYTIGVASQTVESETLHVNDLYVYDGTIWKRKDSTLGTSVTWGTIVGTLSNQTDLQTALDNKANVNDVLTKANTTVYMPSANYHPATKKYVDDSASTKQDTLVSGTNIKTINNESILGNGNITISGGGSTIEYVTQAEYTALLPGAESDGKHYFIYHTSGGGGGWQPGANTLAYYPFDTDILDHSSNSRALTGDTGTKGTIGYTFTSDVKILNADLPSNTKFINFWCKFNSASGNQGVIVAGGLQQLCMSYYAFGRNQGSPSGLDNVITAFVGSGWSSKSHSGPNNINSWHNICLGYDGTDTMCAIDGVRYSLNPGLDPSAVTNELYLLLVDSGMSCSVELADFIIESQGWTAQEISDYYNSTKSKYGIS